VATIVLHRAAQADLEDLWESEPEIAAGIYVLGIFNRDFNYDETDARTRRVLQAYDRLDIPSYR